jgi:hypothetical protein
MNTAPWIRTEQSVRSWQPAEGDTVRRLLIQQLVKNAIQRAGDDKDAIAEARAHR